MDRNYSISIAMATYNGEKYIKEQLDSIINQLNDNDEIVVSDDGSTDDTIKIIKSYKDVRIKIYEGPHNGVKQNFSNAISKCNGKYIFLADQDDIWEDNKVKIILDTFKNIKCTCIVHNCSVFNSNTGNIIYDSFFKVRNSGSGIFKNIFKNTYIGCCMSFEQKLKKYILPIPNDIEMHDQWIGIINEMKYGKSYFVNDKLIKYRRHADNASQMIHYPFIKMLKNRILLLYRLIQKIK